MSEQRESCSGSGGLPGQVDRVRDQGNDGSIGSFVYIECDRVRKCIRLPSMPRPHSALSTVPTPFCFPKDRQYVGVGVSERETERGKGNMFRRKIVQLNNGPPFPAGRMRGSVCNHQPFFLLLKYTLSFTSIYLH